MASNLRTCGPAALALLAALAGCTIPNPEMEARYDASLARWKGVPESTLLATWGAPTAQAVQGDAKVLTFVARNNYGGEAGVHVLQVGRPDQAMVGSARAPAAPLICTTRFVLMNGVVSSWTFDGLGCGAPV
jgi:hypothetical protein